MVDKTLLQLVIKDWCSLRYLPNQGYVETRLVREYIF